MTPRATGKRRPCTLADARARLHDAEAFLLTAEAAGDPDVVATNAIHAGIAAADAICCVALRERSADGSQPLRRTFCVTSPQNSPGRSLGSSS